MFPRSYKPKTIPFQILRKDIVVDVKEEQENKLKGKKNKINPMMAELLKQQEAENEDKDDEYANISVSKMESLVSKKFAEWQRDQEVPTIMLQTQAIYEHFTQQF